METKSALYNLKTVTLLTGINEHTLRAWELRYGAISPRRSAAGRRVYDQQQVERIRMLMMLSERGHAISSIAALTDGELARLFSESSIRPAQRPDDADHGEHELVGELIVHVRKFDLAGVRGMLQQSMLRLGGVDFVLRVVSPLMRHVGSLSTGGAISIAHEHAVSAIVKGSLFELLFSVVQTRPVRNRKRRKIVFATMEGDFHEVGILCASALARIAGHDAIYIGANTPPAAVAAAVNSLQATDVMIGVVDMHSSLLRHSVEGYLGVLRPLITGAVRIGFGGSARMLTGLSGREDAEVYPSLSAFQKTL